MKTTTLLLLLLGSGAATAAEPLHAHAHQSAPRISGLDAAQVSGLLEGRGLGYAKAAELNRYPGPMHVLELARELSLTEAQAEATRVIRARVDTQAKALGAQLVAAEAELDRLFRTGSADAANVTAALDTIASLQARLRGAHLIAHIEQRRLLTPEQVDRYMQLRGHDGDAHSGHGHAH